MYSLDRNRVTAIKLVHKIHHKTAQHWESTQRCLKMGIKTIKKFPRQTTKITGIISIVDGQTDTIAILQ